MVLWVLAIGMYWTLLYGMYPYNKDSTGFLVKGELSPPYLEELEESTHKTVAVLCVAWILYACLTGWGGKNLKPILNCCHLNSYSYCHGICLFADQMWNLLLKLMQKCLLQDSSTGFYLWASLRFLPDSASSGICPIWSSSTLFNSTHTVSSSTTGCW